MTSGEGFHPHGERGILGQHSCVAFRATQEENGSNETRQGDDMRKSKWAVGLLLLAMVLSLLVVVAGCGGEDETTTTAAAPTETTAAPTETTAAPTETTAAPTETTAAAAPMETLKIGAILSLTDWYSVVDAADKVDLEYVAQMINDDGGIKVQGKAYKVELVIEDGKSTLDGNTAAATKLVLDDKLQFVVGPGAFFNLATTPIFEQNKVLHVANYNGLNPAEMNSGHAVRVPGSGPDHPAFDHSEGPQGVLSRHQDRDLGLRRRDVPGL